MLHLVVLLNSVKHTMHPGHQFGFLCDAYIADGLQQVRVEGGVWRMRLLAAFHCTISEEEGCYATGKVPCFQVVAHLCMPGLACFVLLVHCICLVDMGPTVCPSGE